MCHVLPLYAECLCLFYTIYHLFLRGFSLVRHPRYYTLNPNRHEDLQPRRTTMTMRYPTTHHLLPWILCLHHRHTTNTPTKRTIQIHATIPNTRPMHARPGMRHRVPHPEMTGPHQGSIFGNGTNTTKIRNGTMAPVRLQTRMISSLLLPTHHRPYNRVTMLLIGIIIQITLQTSTRPRNEIYHLRNTMRFHRRHNGVLPPPHNGINYTTHHGLRHIRDNVNNKMGMVIGISTIRQMILRGLYRPLRRVIYNNERNKIRMRPLSNNTRPIQINIYRVVLYRVQQRHHQKTRTMKISPHFRPSTPTIHLNRGSVRQIGTKIFTLRPNTRVTPQRRTTTMRHIPRKTRLHRRNIRSRPNTVIRRLHYPNTRNILNKGVRRHPIRVTRPRHPPLPNKRNKIKYQKHVLPKNNNIIYVTFLPRVPPHHDANNYTHPYRGNSTAGTTFYLNFEHPTTLNREISSYILCEMDPTRPQTRIDDVGVGFIRGTEPLVPTCLIDVRGADHDASTTLADYDYH